jgi:hypothetical protein
LALKTRLNLVWVQKVVPTHIFVPSANGLTMGLPAKVQKLQNCYIGEKYLGVYIKKNNIREI